jgi:AcrR family transcriptional regulator
MAQNSGEVLNDTSFRPGEGILYTRIQIRHMRKGKRAESGPGRPPRISRDAIVASARDIVSRFGFEALSMRRISEELDATPMAIYRHVRDKDELLALMLDASYRELRKPRLPQPPRERLIALWIFFYRVLARYPWVIEALARYDVMAPSVLPQLEKLIEASVDCGLTISQAADAYRIVWQYTAGAVMLQQSTAKRAAASYRTPAMQTMSSIDAASMPKLAAAAQCWSRRSGSDSYEAGLNVILDGILAAATSHESEER